MSFGCSPGAVGDLAFGLDSLKDGASVRTKQLVHYQPALYPFLSCCVFILLSPLVSD